MSLREAIEEALRDIEGDELAGTVGRKVRALHGLKKVELHLLDVDRLAVRARRLRVCRGDPVNVQAEARSLSSGAAAVPEQLVPWEVDTALGRAVLRTGADRLRDRRFFELDVAAEGEFDLQRFEVQDNGQRQRADWTMTREQLGQLVEDLAD